MVSITTDNIEDFRGVLGIRPGNLPFDMWRVFDRSAFESLGNSLIVPVAKLVSTKNQLLDTRFVTSQKRDPRQIAFERMVAAANGLIERRAPIKAIPKPDGRFHIEDGNATAQVLMLAGWKEAPIEQVSLNH